MRFSKSKTKLWAIVPASMAIASTMFLASSCGDKGYKVDITCTNCTINDVSQFSASYPKDSEVVLKFTADRLCILDSDVKAISGNRQLVKNIDYTYASDTGEMKFTIKGDTNITVNASAESLNKYTWEEIKEISKQGRARECFKIGATKDVLVNGVTHRVRIIGFNQDVDKDGNKIGITFEFANLLSDVDGLSLAAYWQDTDKLDTAHYDYMNSTIRAVLNGNDYEGSSKADIKWFRYYGPSQDYVYSPYDIGENYHFSDYYDRSAFDMLPQNLKDVITAPNKFIMVFDNDKDEFAETTVNDKLFLLSPREMGFDGPSYPYPINQEPSTRTYEYYEGHPDETDPIRIKRQVCGGYGARTNILSGDSQYFVYNVDGAYGGIKHTSAGYNSETVGEGGDYWLRSPNPNKYLSNSEAWHVQHNGDTTYEGFVYVNDYALAIAPCFCI